MTQTDPATGHSYLMLPHVMVQKVELIIEDKAWEGRTRAGIHHICVGKRGWHRSSFVLPISECDVYFEYLWTMLIGIGKSNLTKIPLNIENTLATEEKKMG